MSLPARDDRPGPDAGVGSRGPAAPAGQNVTPSIVQPSRSSRPASDGLDVSDEDAVELFRLMCVARAIEQRLLTLYRQARFLGGLYCGTGGEAVSVATAYCLETHDILCPLTRDMGARIAKGSPIEIIFRSYLAKVTGPMRGRDGNIHHCDEENNILAMISHLGAMISVTAGAALAENMKGNPVVGMTYIGDGGSSTGDFHEALNMAAVWKAPLVLILENNQYAYSTPTKFQYACEKLSDRAVGYGIPGTTVDGTDLMAVYRAARRAVERARAGDGPSLIECVTLRMRGHGEHDNAEYIPGELFEEWKRKDPIDRFRAVLDARKILSEADADEMCAQVRAEVAEIAARVAKEPDPIAAEVLARGGAYSEKE